jgi:hypothetical protein
MRAFALFFFALFFFTWLFWGGFNARSFDQA